MNRYALESHPNKAMGTFHFTKHIPDIPWLSSGNMTPEARELKELLLKIPGVTEVTGGKQSVRITRGGAYKWEDIEEAVVSTVSSQIGMDSPEKVEPYA